MTKQNHSAMETANVRDLRRVVWSDGSVSLDEAEHMFAINAAAQPGDRDWADFFVEAMVDFLVSRGQPKGFVTDADAEWLMRHIDKDGRVESWAELEMLVRLFERSDQLPEALRAYGLAQIERVVLTGDGPTRRGEPLDPGRINAVEAGLLRRMIFSAGGDTPARVGRSEAEMLFRVKDAALGADNAPEWKQLFVQGVANHLLTDTHPAQPDRGTMLRLEEFMNDHQVSIGRFVGRMMDSAVGGEGFQASDPEPNMFTPDNGGFSAGERDWTNRMIQADAVVDEYEQALLDFLSSEA